MPAVRKMAREDVESVVEIEQCSPSPWSLGQVVEELSRSGGVSLVVHSGKSSVVLGWCCTRVAGCEAELLKIAVSEDCRRAGFGTLLLKELCLSLVKQQVEAVFLEVRSQNRQAIRFYLKHGFREVGRRPNYYKNPADKALIFRKELLYSAF